jgi:hypothetical protein
MESRELRRTVGAQGNITWKRPPSGTLSVSQVLVLCGIHLLYSIAHQEQSGVSWLKQTVMLFLGCNSRRCSHIFGIRTVGRPFVEIPAGLAPAQFAVHQSSGDCTFSVCPFDE